MAILILKRLAFQMLARLGGHVVPPFSLQRLLPFSLQLRCLKALELEPHAKVRFV